MVKNQFFSAKNFKKIEFDYSKKSSGFSLIELLIVVAIIAVIVVVAFPSYQNYVQKTKRGDLKANLQTIVANIENKKSVATPKQYTSISLAEIGFSSTGVKHFPSDSNKMYRVTITNANSKLTRIWEIVATPETTGDMNDTGVLKINSLGNRCWTAGASDCSLSSSSNWDE